MIFFFFGDFEEKNKEYINGWDKRNANINVGEAIFQIANQYSKAINWKVYIYLWAWCMCGWQTMKNDFQIQPNWHFVYFIFKFETHKFNDKETILLWTYTYTQIQRWWHVHGHILYTKFFVWTKFPIQLNWKLFSNEIQDSKAENSNCIQISQCQSIFGVYACVYIRYRDISVLHWDSVHTQSQNIYIYITMLFCVYWNV